MASRSGVAHPDPSAQDRDGSLPSRGRTFRRGGSERLTPVSGSPAVRLTGSSCCHVDLFGYKGV